MFVLLFLLLLVVVEFQSLNNDKNDDLEAFAFVSGIASIDAGIKSFKKEPLEFIMNLYMREHSVHSRLLSYHRLHSWRSERSKQKFYFLELSYIFGTIQKFSFSYI
jgi:hypothetical protein